MTPPSGPQARLLRAAHVGFRDDRIYRLPGDGRGHQARPGRSGDPVPGPVSSALPGYHGGHSVPHAGHLLSARSLTMASPTIRNTIRRLRFESGEMTQQHLAAQAGVTRQTIVAIEGGKYAPSLELAFKIASVFGKPLEEVFQYENGNPPGQGVDGRGDRTEAAENRLSSPSSPPMWRRRLDGSGRIPRARAGTRAPWRYARPARRCGLRRSRR